MDNLQKLPNIGKVLSAQLNEVGVYDIVELTKRGSRDVWLAIKAIDPSACYNRLMGLEGAIQNIRWHHLDEGTKAELKEFYLQYR